MDRRWSEVVGAYLLGVCSATVMPSGGILRAVVVCWQCYALRRIVACQWPVRALLDAMHVNLLWWITTGGGEIVVAMCAGKWLTAQGGRERMAMGLHLAAVSFLAVWLPDGRAAACVYCSAECVWRAIAARPPPSSATVSDVDVHAFAQQLRKR